MAQLIAIRVDGNSNIGFGHLIRMQALARQLVNCGVKVIFLSRNSENIKDYQVKQLNSQAGSKEEDQEVEQILQHIKADMLIIDSYTYEQERLDKMAGLNTFSVYIDDMNLYKFNIDMLVNGNLYAPVLPYQGSAEFLLGSQYLLMREEFADLLPRMIASDLKDIMITFGAADMKNITPWMISILTDYKLFSQLNWHVVIGPAYKNTVEIERLVQDQQNVHIYHNQDMKSLIERCDLCISAAGSTVYELAVCGTPAVLIVVADNQLRLAAEAHSRGIAINLGWYENISAHQIYAALDQLMNYDLRQTIAKQGQRLIDGKGAFRVAHILLDRLNKNS